MRAAAVLASAGLLTACPGTLDDPDRFLEAGLGGDDSGATTIAPTEDASAPSGEGPTSPACPDIVATVFTPTCATSGCHSSTSPASGLDLQSPGIYARLLGKAATGGPGDLIDPSGNAQDSVLYTVLTATPPFGARMPLGGTPLDSTTLACVASWIASGGDSAGGAEGGAPDAGAEGEEGGLDAGTTTGASNDDAAAPLDGEAE